MVLTWSPRQCHSPPCCWLLSSCPTCCFHPAGSPPPLWGSPPPGHRLRGPKRQNHAPLQNCALFNAKVFGGHLYSPTALSRLENYKVLEEIFAIEWQNKLTAPSITLVCLCGICLREDTVRAHVWIIVLRSIVIVALLSVVAQCRLYVVVTLQGTGVPLGGRSPCGEPHVGWRGATWRLPAEQLDGQPLKPPPPKKNYCKKKQEQKKKKVYCRNSLRLCTI